MLLVYAGVYDHYLGDFYQTTAIYESAFHQTEGELVSELTSVLRQAAAGAPPSRGAGPETVVLQSDTVAISDFSVADPTTFAFELRYSCAGPHSEGSGGLMLTLAAKGGNFQIGPDVGVSFQYELDQTGIDPGCGFDIGTLAGVPLSHQHSKSIEISVDAATKRHIDALVRAKEGFTDELPGRQVRSLYLSVVTITTLGFGDVVPVTTRARFIVGTEALGGVIVVGLFLNAVAGRGRRESGPFSSGAARGQADDAK